MLSRLVRGIEEKEDQTEALGHVVKPARGGALGIQHSQLDKQARIRRV